MEDYYNAISRSYKELHEEEQRKKLNILTKTWKPKGLILDIGCGSNIANNYFKNIIGIDKSQKMLRKGVNVCGIAERLPFKDKTFDAILCLTAIHNFDDINKVLKEMKRVLKKDNIAISILKKTKNFNKIKRAVLKNFDMACIEEEKDIILICQKD